MIDPAIGVVRRQALELDLEKGDVDRARQRYSCFDVFGEDAQSCPTGV